LLISAFVGYQAVKICCLTPSSCSVGMPSSFRF
jgi:hypothetical protein